MAMRVPGCISRCTASSYKSILTFMWGQNPESVSFTAMLVSNEAAAR